MTSVKRKITVGILAAVTAGACLFTVPACSLFSSSSASEYVSSYGPSFTQTSSSGTVFEGVTYYAMDTWAELIIEADFSDEETVATANIFAEEVGALLEDTENSISAGIAGSYTDIFNNAEAGETVETDRIFYEVMTRATEAYHMTDGYYNPGVYLSGDLYGFAPRPSGADAEPYDRDDVTEELPDEAYIGPFRELAGSFGEIERYEEDGRYYAVKPQNTVEVDGVEYSLKIDLGGIGKGYVAGIVYDMFDEYGFMDGYFNFGSSSMAVRQTLSAADGTWTLNFTAPRHNTYYLSARIIDVNISSSGDYEQYYELDGTRYCHIIDPTTGMPVQTGTIAATVIGGDAAEDDALTTAIMCMGRDRAIEFIDKYLGDRTVVFVEEWNGKYLVFTNRPDDVEIEYSKYKLANTLDGDGNIAVKDKYAA